MRVLALSYPFEPDQVRPARRGPGAPLVGLLCLGVFSLFGCATGPYRIKPRDPPTRDVRFVEAPLNEQDPDAARILFDTTDGPMRISAKEVISAHSNEVDVKKPRSGYVCTTPCWADLRRGRYSLYLSPPRDEDFANGIVPPGSPSTGDSDSIRVEPGRWVYRRAPGHFTPPQPADYVLPSLAVGASVLTLGVGATVWGVSRDPGAEVAAAAVTTAALAGAILGGIWLYRASRGEIQDGSTTFFPTP